MDSPTVPEPMLGLVRTVLSDRLKVDTVQVAADMDWRDLPEMESRVLFAAVHELEERLNIELPLDRLIVTRTVLELAELVHDTAQGGISS